MVCTITGCRVDGDEQLEVIQVSGSRMC